MSEESIILYIVVPIFLIFMVLVSLLIPSSKFLIRKRKNKISWRRFSILSGLILLTTLCSLNSEKLTLLNGVVIISAFVLIYFFLMNDITSDEKDYIDKEKKISKKN